MAWYVYLERETVRERVTILHRQDDVLATAASPSSASKPSQMAIADFDPTDIVIGY